MLLDFYVDSYIIYSILMKIFWFLFKKKKNPGKPQIEILYSQLTDCN